MSNKTQLEQQIRKDLLLARKNKDTVAFNILSLLVTEINNLSIENNRKPLTEKQIYGIIKKLVKSLRDSIAIYKSQGSSDLLNEDEAQLKILEKYLPTMLSEEQLRKIVQDTVKKVGNNMGAIMKSVLSEYGASVDGSLLAKIVRDVLSNS